MPITLPSGTPNAIAEVMPAYTTASARPRRSGAVMRAAVPEAVAANSAAPAPATNLLTSRTAYDVAIAESTLPTANTASTATSSVRRSTVPVRPARIGAATA
ncbi:hypothetical protein SAMN05444320_11467 [Streptoalloteichus hindustanus]|uniref:Uncharacterized protein n=1 Tax=Streptoalloteichus hindustanus TaxID=2017 RepID=A0A1M5MVW0_STRHI|nr:hypothetical protein [Streptoalloteichus hindustanus]SHG81262.1 hypothetical protein SAMN05444320_11467 [Streptoalloteichus hindustanus]